MTTTRKDGRTWERKSGEPLTTEREVLVCDPETGEEGYVRVSWDLSRGTGPKVFGAVCKVDRVYDEHGAEIEEPKRTVIDATPKFA